MNQIDLAGRVAVVTGGGQGIGYAIAERMLASGAAVSLWDLDAGKLAEAKDSLGKAGKVFVEEVELTSEGAVAAAAARTIGSAGKIDIVVNNAGITGGNGTTWELAPDVWRRVLEVNLVAPYLVCRAIVPHMIERKYGRIVNVASVAGKEGNPNASHYSASKAGVIALTKSLGKELADQGRARQRDRTGGGEDSDVRDDDPGAHRLHAVEDPDGALHRRPRNRGDGGLHRVRGLLVHDRLGVRSLGRTRDVLSRARCAGATQRAATMVCSPVVEVARP